MKNLLKSTRIRILFGLEVFLLLLCFANLFRARKEIYIESDKQQLHAGTCDPANGNYIDGQDGYTGIFSLSPCISLPAGSYRICLEYDTDTDMANGCGLLENTGTKGWLLANPVNLYSGLNKTDFLIWLFRRNDTLQIYTSYNGTEGYLAVKGITVYETRDFRLMLLTVLLLLFFLADILYIFLIHVQSGKISRQNAIIATALAATILISSIPLMVDYLLVGDDLSYHLLRLEGLRDALAARQFPVRLYPRWLAGHGYADSIMYGSLLLYIPALFRLLGLPLQTCYKLYVLFINVGTCLTAYLSYGKMFKNKYLGLLGCLLTMLAPYRLYCIYQRAAVGEYSAMMFLPLLCYGLYRIFARSPEQKEYKRYWLLPTIAYSGIIQTHVLTCEMVGGFTVLLCLLLWKKVFRKKTFMVLAKTVLFTVLLNAWFLVPFLEYLLSGNLNASHAFVRIQHKGLFLAHLLQFFPYAGPSQPHSFYEGGMKATPPLTAGFSTLIGIFTYLYLCAAWKQKNLPHYKTGKTVFVLFTAALFMSTRYFPWDIVQDMSSIISKIVSSIQFPMRFLTMVIPFAVIITCMAGAWVIQEGLTRNRQLYFGSVMAIALFCGLLYGNDCLSTKNFWRIYDVNGMATVFAMGEEYLPVGTDSSLLRYNPPIGSEDVEILHYSKEDFRIELHCANNTDTTAYIEVPLIFYKGYQAKDMASGNHLDITYGSNNVVRVLIPARYSGTILISFMGMWYWRLAELVSLATAIGCAVYLRKQLHRHPAKNVVR